MDDLISRQAAIDTMHQYSHFDDFDASVVDEDLAVKALKDLPSADTVEVVRCKDCKWCEADYYTDGNVPYWICRNWDGGTDADGFCYEAERKTDG